MKVYEAVAEALVAEGCGPMFGLMGDGNMSLWSALGKDSRVRMVSHRHEAAAVAAADGYARTTGRLGVATVTCGPGLTQVGTSLGIAVRNRSPLVLVVGEIPHGAKNKLQSMDQRRFVEACGARFVSVTSADNLAEEVAEAFYAARAHRTAVVLNLDNALQEQSFDWDFTYRPSAEFLPQQPLAPSEDQLAAVFEKLVAAERPVVVAGRGAKYAGAKDEIVRLADRVGALLATSLQGKGLFAGHPYDVGIAGSFSSAPTEELLAEADFVLGIGAELGYYTSEGGLLFPQAEVARIDVRPMPEEIGILPGLFVRADALRATAALNAMLEARQVRKDGFRTAATRDVLASPPHAYEKPSDGLDPRALMRHLSAGLPEGTAVTCGGGHYFSFPAMYLALPEGADIQFSVVFGAVGQALPLAIGAGVAHGRRPHLLIEGDGSMMFYLQELETVVREGLQLTVLIMNDGGFGAEVHKLRAKGKDESLAQWSSPNFVAIAKAFGGDGVLLRSEAEVGEAVAAGLKKGGLYVVDARVSPTTVSDPYAKIHFGLPNRAPLLRRPERVA
jgi:thiamine pyrophosphate-dependent acetolactate synthase large subunit-like protein